MSRKHFEDIANTIAIRLDATDDVAAKMAIVGLAKDLCRDFCAFNSRFDTNRFLAACGIVD